MVLSRSEGWSSRSSFILTYMGPNELKVITSVQKIFLYRNVLSVVQGVSTVRQVQSFKVGQKCMIFSDFSSFGDFFPVDLSLSVHLFTHLLFVYSR